MGFEDLGTAAEFRDIIEQIAFGVVNRARPELIVGKVYSINKATQKAKILLPGETVANLIVARFAMDKVPTNFMETSYNTLGMGAPGDIVRLYGKDGSYFILDFVFGTPEGVSGGGSGGSASATQRFEFTNPSIVWLCNHTFNTTSVFIATYTPEGVKIDGDEAILSSTQVQIQWDGSLPQVGYALISI